MEFIRVVFGITFLIFSLQVQAQSKFFKSYTGKGYDFGEGIVQLADSSYLITGASSSFGDGPAQAFILHVDKFGGRIWSKSYGGQESERGRRIFYVENDGIYVAGYSSSMSQGSFDFYFFKTDLSGNLLFEKTYGGPGFEKLHDAVLVPGDTSFILVGETKSNPEEIENMYIMRLKSNGDTLWTKQLGSSGLDIARGVEMISDTTFVVAGDYYDTNSNHQKAFLMKMHINGTEDWLKKLGNEGDYSFNDVAFDESRIRAVGYNRYTKNNVDYSRTYSFVADIDGNTLNQIVDSSASGGTYTRYGYLTSYSENSNKFYISEQSTLGVTPTLVGGGEDIIIARFEGFLYWSGTGINASYIGDDQINQLIRTSDGGAVSIGYNSAGGAGGNNITLLKIGKNDDFVPPYTIPNEGSLVFKEELDESIQVSIYPNPVEEMLQIEVASHEEVQLVVLNSLGVVVAETEFNHLTSIDLSDYPNGLYFVKLEISGATKTFKVLKK